MTKKKKCEQTTGISWTVMDMGRETKEGGHVEAAFSDVDGDGDLDMFAAGKMWHHVWLNDGHGNFHVKPGYRDAPDVGSRIRFVVHDC